MVKATVPDGDRYRATVPDTLDLAERGSIALKALSEALDLQRDYEMCFLVRYGVRPPYMYHDAMTYNLPARPDERGRSRAHEGSRPVLPVQHHHLVV
jgi:hypothetical protein